MSNRLKHENSPYLLQHKKNPVDWYPWGEDALKKAQKVDKPIFLSIGYAACHWCHVMERESFEDLETAAIMNDNFINIKVDREERPDLDNIYMNATVALTGSGGWPLSVFLTPGGEPFFGGTYFPPARRYNMPSFKELLLSIQRLWQEDRHKLLESSKRITDYLQNISSPFTDTLPLDPDTLQQALMRLAQNYDWRDGGWGKAPKFPQPMVIRFLLRRAARGDQLALDNALHALLAMARGGLYDVVGGGFARYSVDDRWVVPHFEKMLYDNAQLSRVYLHAYLISRDTYYRRICEETLDFVLREMTHAQGGFFSSLDADSEGEEGKFYVWSLNELQTVIADEEDWRIFFAAYAPVQDGNFEGKNILHGAADYKTVAIQLEMTPAEIAARLADMHAKLRIARAQRTRPNTDDKVIVSWNAFMLQSFAEAARYLQRDDYLSVAIRNADFVLEQLHPEDRLLRSWRDGRARHNAYLEDYAALILALLALYQSDPNSRWFQSAYILAQDMMAHFSDPQGGFYDTRSDHEQLITRPKDLQDNATPSGNALAANALLQLAAYTGETELHDMAINLLGGMQAACAKFPIAYAEWLSAIDLALHPPKEIAILGDLSQPLTQELIDIIWESYRPDFLVAIANYPVDNEAPPLLQNRPLLNDKPTAYVCQNFTCQLPVNQPEELRRQLGERAPNNSLA